MSKKDILLEYEEKKKLYSYQLGDIDLIFDKFYQSKHQNIRKPVGTGLGLAICKKIIDAHQGKIYAENKEIGVTINILMNNDKNEAV